MCLYWLFNAFVGLFLSVRAGKHFLVHKAAFHLYMMLIFIAFGTGWVFIGYLLGTGKFAYPLGLVWTLITITAALLLTPVFYKHFFVLAGDIGGLCLEAAIVTMVIGLMFIATDEYRALPFVGMMSLAALFFGYVRLQNLLRSADC